MKVKRLRKVALEISKTIKNIKPNYMKYVFTPKTDASVRPNDILVKSHKTANYGDTSLTVLGPKIWNQFPKFIKLQTCFSEFKEYIDTWFRTKCKCNICVLT